LAQETGATGLPTLVPADGIGMQDAEISEEDEVLGPDTEMSEEDEALGPALASCQEKLADKHALACVGDQEVSTVVLELQSVEHAQVYTHAHVHTLATFLLSPDVCVKRLKLSTEIICKLTERLSVVQNGMQTSLDGAGEGESEEDLSQASHISETQCMSQVSHISETQTFEM